MDLNRSAAVVMSKYKPTAKCDRKCMAKRYAKDKAVEKIMLEKFGPSGLESSFFKNTKEDVKFWSNMTIIARRRAIEKEAEEEYLNKTMAVFDFSNLII